MFSKLTSFTWGARGQHGWVGVLLFPDQKLSRPPHLPHVPACGHGSNSPTLHGGAMADATVAPVIALAHDADMPRKWCLCGAGLVSRCVPTTTVPAQHAPQGLTHGPGVAVMMLRDMVESNVSAEGSL